MSSAPRITVPRDHTDATIQINKAFEQIVRLIPKISPTSSGLASVESIALQAQIDHLNVLSGNQVDDTGSGVTGPTNNPGIATVETDGVTIGGDGVDTAIFLETPVAIGNGGTGETAPALVAGFGIAITGAWPDQTIATTGAIVATYAIYIKAIGDSPYTMPTGNLYLLASADPGADFIANMPSATGSGDVMVVKKMDADLTHSIAVTPNGTDTIDGTNAAFNILVPNDAYWFLDYGAGTWALI